MYFHVYLIYRFTRTFTDHSSVITRCWVFELQNGQSSLKSLQTLAAQSFAPASFLSTHSKRSILRDTPFLFSKLFCDSCTETCSFAYFRFYVDSWGREETHLVRITHLRRDGTGEVSFITGWMVEPGGKLRMTTPYGGESYARNG